MYKKIEIISSTDIEEAEKLVNEFLCSLYMEEDYKPKNIEILANPLFINAGDKRYREENIMYVYTIIYM